MNIKKQLVILLSAFIFLTPVITSGQTGTTKKTSSSPVFKPPYIKRNTAVIEKEPSITDPLREDNQLNFVCKTNADTLLPANTVFEESIEISNFRARINMTSVPYQTQFKKDEKLTTVPLETTFHDYNLKEKPNNIIILVADNKKEKNRTFRIFLDKKKKHILRIQDLDTKKIYQSAKKEAVGPAN